MPDRPLLIMPRLGPPLKRVTRPMFIPETFHLPSREDIAERFSSKFTSMIESVVLESPDGVSPENVLVLETVGKIEDFRAAASKIPGLTWQAEVDIDEIESDEDFFERPKIGPRFFVGKVEGLDSKSSKLVKESLAQHELINEDGFLVDSFDESQVVSAVPEELKEFSENILETIRSEKKKPVEGRIYLCLSNRQALDQVKRLFDAVQRGEDIPQLNATWKKLFSHLHNIRYWDVEDRVRDTGILKYWQDELEIKKGTSSTIAFEVELTFSNDPENRRVRQQSIEQLVLEEEGRVDAVCIIPEIRFHALKVNLPVGSIERVLAGEYGALFRSGSVMFFRPAAQCCSRQLSVGDLRIEVEEVDRPEEPPVIALFDGLPLPNHTLLEHFLIIDDPEGFSEDYEPNEFCHGTAMASLICHGELDSGETPLKRKIYVRPILKPEDLSGRNERIPGDVFFEDLLERAVRRMFEEIDGEPPAAPTVKIINLSVADPDRMFHRFPGPTAKLLDWLSYKYGVLFCVSVGNFLGDFDFEDDEFEEWDDDEKICETLEKINSNKINRRLLSPAEAINVISVGAAHDDKSTIDALRGRVDILPDRTLFSPISSLGHGFRSSIKPEILMPGGRQLYYHKGDGLFGISDSPEPPGQKVAAAPVHPGEINRAMYTRGTSNATALASRSAGLIYDVLEELGVGSNIEIPNNCVAPIIKALLVHGASWGAAAEFISSELKLKGHAKRKEPARFMGYGIPDIQKSLNCTMTRATAIGFGAIEKDKRHEFRFPLPQGLSGMDVWRRLTITLAWLSPIGVENRKYRRAALAFDPKGLDDQIGGSRNEAQWQQVKNGTVQHEIIEGTDVVAYLEGLGDELLIPVQCREDANPLDAEIPYGLAVTLEVKEEVEIYIYEEVRTAIEIAVREHLSA